MKHDVHGLVKHTASDVRLFLAESYCNLPGRFVCLIFLLEVSGLNLYCNTYYPAGILLWLSSVLQEKSETTP